MSPDQLDELLAKLYDLIVRARALLVLDTDGEDATMELRVILHLAQDVYMGLDAAQLRESEDALSRPEPAARG